MKKKIFMLLLSATVFTVAGCGKEVKEEGKEVSTEVESTTEPTAEPTPEAVDLTGTWRTEENEGSYQEAVIGDGTIEINWVLDGGNTTALYWAGSFLEKATDGEKVVSENDHAKTDTALMASGDDTKEFTIEDGTITYSASAAGVTKKLVLAKTE